MEVAGYSVIQSSGDNELPAQIPGTRGVGVVEGLLVAMRPEGGRVREGGVNVEARVYSLPFFWLRGVAGGGVRPFRRGGGLIFASEVIFSGDSSCWKRRVLFSHKIGSPHWNSKEGLG